VQSDVPLKRGLFGSANAVPLTAFRKMVTHSTTGTARLDPGTALVLQPGMLQQRSMERARSGVYPSVPGISISSQRAPHSESSGSRKRDVGAGCAFQRFANPASGPLGFTVCEMGSSGHVEHHERHIIVLRSACCERLCGSQDPPHTFQSWKPMTRLGEFDQSLFAPFFVAKA